MAPFAIAAVPYITAATKVAMIAGAAYYGSRLATRDATGKMGAPSATSTVGPSPTTVMAAERAEADRGLQKKRRRLSVMGGDYGQLMTTQQKLGT